MTAAMTIERQKKLFALKRREEMKDALNEDLKAQYSARGVPSQRIEREVQNFIRCAGLTETNLNRLTRRMDKHAAKKDDDNMSTVTGVSAYSARSTMTGVSKYSESQPEQKDTQPAEAVPAVPAPGTTTPGRRLSTPKDGLPAGTLKSGGLGVTGAKLAPITEDCRDAASSVGDHHGDGDFPWAELDKYAALLHERDACQKKEQTVRLQSELKRDLDQQVQDARARKQKERDDDHSYFQSQVGEIEKWKEHEKSRIEEQKIKHQKEKADRDVQLDYSNSLKQTATEAQLSEDRQLLDKIAQELDTERRLYDTRRKQHKEAMGKVWENTQSDVEEKKNDMQKQHEEDTKQMNEYIKMLEEKEKKTAKDAKDRLDAHARFLDNIKAAGLEDEKDRVLTDTVRVATEQKAATRRATEAERTKRENLKSMRLENQSYLFGQMKEKQSIKERNQEEKLMQAEYLASDTAHFHETEKGKLIDKRSRNLDHRRELENQIMANMKPYPGLAVSHKSAAAGTEANMSSCEVRMNKRLVAEVKSALSSTC